jgi:hypothetical protein
LVREPAVVDPLLEAALLDSQDRFFAIAQVAPMTSATEWDQT